MSVNKDDDLIIRLAITDNVYNQYVSYLSLDNNIGSNLYKHAYICLEKFHLRTPIGDNNIIIGVFCDSLRDVYAINQERSFEPSYILDQLVGSVGNPDILFDYSNSYDNWQKISVSSLNNLKFMVSYSNGGINPYYLYLKIKLSK